VTGTVAVLAVVLRRTVVVHTPAAAAVVENLHIHHQSSAVLEGQMVKEGSLQGQNLPAQMYLDQASFPFLQTSSQVSLETVPSSLACQAAFPSSSMIKKCLLTRKYSHHFCGVELISKVRLFRTVCSPRKLIESVIEKVCNIRAYTLTHYFDKFIPGFLHGFSSMDSRSRLNRG
jgi:hypothetical protein